MFKIKYARLVLTKDFPKLKSANLLEQFLREVELLRNDPFSGKQLTGPLKGKRSVRINLQHRIFYTVEKTDIVIDAVKYDGIVTILQAFGHDFD